MDVLTAALKLRIKELQGSCRGSWSPQTSREWPGIFQLFTCKYRPVLTQFYSIGTLLSIHPSILD